MEHLFFCPRWGSEHLTWASFAKKVKDAGYDGVETSLPASIHEQEDMLIALNQQGLRLIGVHWDTVTADFAKHKEEMEERILALVNTNPMFITSHTGKDHFTFEQNIELLELCNQISETTGTLILHETHRGKFSFAAHLTKTYLQQLPWLQLTLDISHWFAVAESYLEDQTEAVDLALQHTAHIHTRVGFTQGPQVDDPRNEEGDKALAHHLSKWDKVVELQISKGMKQLTFTPEFGPYPYMRTMQNNQGAVDHQWKINKYMKDKLKSRYYAS